jgi:thymidylate synthase (FAD)
MENGLAVHAIAQTPNPQTAVWMAMHQDYSEDAVWDCTPPEEWRCGQIIVERLLKGDRGHYGPLEHPQMTINAVGFPHSTMQQLRTHRHLTFDVQSGRYTGQRFLDVTQGRRSVEDVFWLRPVGEYSDRKGRRYSYTERQRRDDLEWCRVACQRYAAKIAAGFSEEHARAMIPFEFRQDWVMSAGARAIMHLLDLRWKKDAQWECQLFSELLFERFKLWMPAAGAWYEQTRAGKARLAP